MWQPIVTIYAVYMQCNSVCTGIHICYVESCRSSYMGKYVEVS